MMHSSLVVSVSMFLLVLLLLDNLVLDDDSFDETASMTTTKTIARFKNEESSSSSKTTTQKEEEPFHVCQQSLVTFADASQLKISYQCQGPAYDNFTQFMWQYVHDKSEATTAKQGADSWSPSWGRRRFPFPANTSVLALGNSHTRQVMAAIPCQYHHVVKSTTLHDGEFIHSYHFDNHATLTIVFNSPILYTQAWPRLLQVALQRPIDSYHAIVVGEFNSIAKPQNTNFYRRTMAFFNDSNNTDEHAIQPDNPHGPMVAQVAAQTLSSTLSIPLLALTSFDAKRQVRLQKSAQRLQQQSHNNNTTRIVDLYNGRYHVENLQHECGSDFQTAIPQSACFNQKNAKSMHRCTGPLGGHADLVAWDVMEWVYRRLQVLA